MESNEESLYPFEAFVKEEIDHVFENMVDGGLLNEDTSLSSQEREKIIEYVVNDDWLNEQINIVITEAINQAILSRGEKHD